MTFKMKKIYIVVNQFYLARRTRKAFIHSFTYVRSAFKKGVIYTCTQKVDIMILDFFFILWSNSIFVSFSLLLHKVWSDSDMSR